MNVECLVAVQQVGGPIVDVGCIQREGWNKNGRESDRCLLMMMTEQVLSMIFEVRVMVWDKEQQHKPWKDEDGFLAGTKEDMMVVQLGSRYQWEDQYRVCFVMTRSRLILGLAT
jgi:hypothetical protein